MAGVELEVEVEEELDWENVVGRRRREEKRRRRRGRGEESMVEGRGGEGRKERRRKKEEEIDRAPSLSVCLGFVIWGVGL